MKKLLAVVMIAAMSLALVGPASAAKKKKKKKAPSGPVVMFEDVAGDAGTENTGPTPGFAEAGFDLLEGQIEQKGEELHFTVTHSAMPETGTLPEGFRFLWHFNIGSDEYRFTAKSADIGKPDVLAQSGTERVGQVDTDGHFRLETCAEEALPAVLTLLNCNTVENGYLEGSFDPAAAAFTIVLPLELIEGKKGTTITAGSGGASDTNCVVCWVPQYAERSLTPSTVIDSAAVLGEFKVR